MLWLEFDGDSDGTPVNKLLRIYSKQVVMYSQILRQRLGPGLQRTPNHWSSQVPGKEHGAQDLGRGCLASVSLSSSSEPCTCSGITHQGVLGGASSCYLHSHAFPVAEAPERTAEEQVQKDEALRR